MIMLNTLKNTTFPLFVFELKIHINRLHIIFMNEYLNYKIVESSIVIRQWEIPYVFERKYLSDVNVSNYIWVNLNFYLNYNWFNVDC